MNRTLYKNAISAVALIWSSILWDDDGVQRKRNGCVRSGRGIFQCIVWIFGWMSCSELFTGIKRSGRVVHTVRTCLNSVLKLNCLRVKTAKLRENLFGSRLWLRRFKTESCMRRLTLENWVVRVGDER